MEAFYKWSACLMERPSEILAKTNENCRNIWWFGEKAVRLQQQIPPRFPLEQRNRAELRFYMGLRYTKQALDYPQILQQLKDRGLRFHDEQKAIAELRNICYFRIANYLRFFEQRGTDCHAYKANTYFEDALQIYYLDKHSINKNL